MQPIVRLDKRRLHVECLFDLIGAKHGFGVTGEKDFPLCHKDHMVRAVQDRLEIVQNHDDGLSCIGKRSCPIEHALMRNLFGQKA